MTKWYILFFLLFTLTGFSQTISTFPGTPFTNFSDLDVEGSKIVALGDCNQVWYTDDDGQKWSFFELSKNYSSVHFIPDKEDEVMLVGSDELLMYNFSTLETSVITDDIIQNSGFIHAADKIGNTLYFYTSKGVHSYDFTTMAFENKWEWNNTDSDFVACSAPAGNYIYLGTHRGKIIKYNISDEDAEIAIDFEQRIQYLAMADENTGYGVVNGESSLLKTTNQWMNYTQVTGMPESIRPVATGDMVVTINTNRMYRSENGGTTSQYLTYGDEGKLGLIFCSHLTEEGVLYLGGGASTLIKTEDFGLNFTDLNPAIRSDFYDIDMLENGVGFCVGNGSHILKTTDNGNTWTPLNITIDRPNLTQIVAFDENHFIVQSDGSLFTVQNGVVTDEKVVDAYDVITVPGAQHILLLSNDGSTSSIHKSSDQGASWEEVFSTEDQLYRFSLSPDGRIFCTGQDISAYESVDGGNQWNIKTFPYKNLTDVQFFDANIGLIIQGSNLYKTTNGGTTFNTVANRYFIRNLTWLKADHYFYTSAQNNETNLFESRNGGTTEQKVYGVCTPTNDISVAADNHLVLCHQDGHINRFMYTPINTSTYNTNILQVSLSPNPVMAGSSLHFGEVYESIELISPLGQRVLSAKQTEQVDIPGYIRSGMYIVHIKHQGQSMIGKVVVKE